MNIIGVSAFFHDSACCLLRNGRLVAAAEEERFTRIKHDPSLPVRAFAYCLREGGLTAADIDCVAYYEDPRKKLARQIWMGLPEFPLAGPGKAPRYDASRPERSIREGFGYSGRIEYVDHHLSHAASAFFCSGFREAAIFTVDGVGEWATTTYARGAGAELEIFEEVQFPDSLGLLYSALTSYLGFDVNDAEYKVMGLAPYGKPVYVDKVRRLVSTGESGQYALDMRYFDFLRRERMYSDELVALFGEPPRAPESAVAPFHQDLARSLQAVLEEILLEKCRYLRARVPSENLCMAGGVALNCVANGRIRREGPFKELYVQPAASDAGGALGAAALAHVRLTGKRPNGLRLPHVYLGPGYSGREIAEFLAPTPLRTCRALRNPREKLKATAERLAEGKVVGWFDGRMEYGPRALGARSILADPRGPEMRDRINALVKMREAFRPFAPAVLEEKAHEHFDLRHPSRFMLETCSVTSRLDLPAITHVDGSARVQTVNRRFSPVFHALIGEFDRLTGCPILLNTSFNLRGEPIVRTPFDALWCFVRSGIDVLVLGDFIIDRKDLPPAWLEEGLRFDTRVRSAHEQGVGHAVYTFF